MPGLSISLPFIVTAGTVTTVTLPSTVDLETNDTVENKGIHVTALAEVTVYGLTRIQYTTDAYLGLPVDILGTEHIVLGYPGVGSFSAQFALVGTQNGTTVTITPSVTAGGHPAGVPFNIVLNQGQTYQLQANDVSGTIITSDKPISVFGGTRCANIPPGVLACDTVVEQLPPTATWGKSFVTMPLATRLKGDTFRFLASTNGTEVKVNGTTVATLNRGQLHEQIVTGPAQIVATEPILVAQYSNGSNFDGVTSDPFMMLIPPYEQFLGGYTVSTPASGFVKNFINVVAPDAAVGTIALDGVPIPAGSFTTIGGSGFSGAQLPVSLGTHTLTGGGLPFGAFVYGFDSYDSYGYPGGLSLAPVARVDSVTVAPKTGTNPVGTQHCVTATVLDQNDAPLEGIRVDFAVTGVNPTAGFANTAANGQAQFCYTGTNPGGDSIVASVGTLSDTAAKTWTQTAGAGISGIKFNDVNRSGIQEPSEGGVKDVVIFLDTDGDGVLDDNETSTTSAADGGYFFADLSAGSYRVCEIVVAPRVATSPRCTTVQVAADTITNGVNFGNVDRLPGCTGGTLIDTIVALNPVEPAGDPVASVFYRPTSLKRQGTPLPFKDTRLLVQPTGNNPIVYVRTGEEVSNALLVSGVNGIAHTNLVLKFNYQKTRQSIIEVVAADGTAAAWASPASGTNLPNPLPTTFTVFDKGGELYIFGVPKTADGAGFQDVFVITRVTATTGFITTTAAIAGKVSNNRIVTIGNTCGDKAESTIFGGTPQTTGPLPGATPVDDVPDKGANLNPF